MHASHAFVSPFRRKRPARHPQVSAPAAPCQAQRLFAFDRHACALCLQCAPAASFAGPAQESSHTAQVPSARLCPEAHGSGQPASVAVGLLFVWPPLQGAHRALPAAANFPAAHARHAATPDSLCRSLALLAVLEKGPSRDI